MWYWMSDNTEEKSTVKCIAFYQESLQEIFFDYTRPQQTYLLCILLEKKKNILLNRKMNQNLQDDSETHRTDKLMNNI